MSQVSLRKKVTCPHCWNEFPPEQILWIASHPELCGDPLLGGEQTRFIPTRFTVEGQAIDARGMKCHRLACPRCHLHVPRLMLEMAPIFISILGAPSSGKSYFLASMTWQLRKTLREQCRLGFEDSDPGGSQILIDYEQTLFLSDKADQLVFLPKTEKEGNLYQSVRFGEREVWYPKPFIFRIHPLENHPAFRQRNVLSRALCLYDNAGEHFLPGEETSNSPGTQHLAQSQVLLFMFDPTQHARFRAQCSSRSKDPQMREHGVTHRQDQVLLEAANRIRVHSGLSQNEKYDRPLVVVVTKFDAWSCLFDYQELQSGWVLKKTTDSVAGLDMTALGRISDKVRAIVERYAPEMVTAAESFSKHVVYIPVSALGRSPEVAGEQGFLGIRPKDISPMWVEIPILYGLSHADSRLVRSGRSVRKGQSSTEPSEYLAPKRSENDNPDSYPPRVWRETGS